MKLSGLALQPESPATAARPRMRCQGFTRGRGIARMINLPRSAQNWKRNHVMQRRGRMQHMILAIVIAVVVIVAIFFAIVAYRQ